MEASSGRIRYSSSKMNIPVIIVSLFVSSVLTEPRKYKKSNLLPEIWNDVAYRYLDREGNNCPGCAEVRAHLRKHEDDVNMTDIRIAMAKHNILQKLGLKAVPNVAKDRRDSLPPPVLERLGLEQEVKPAQKYEPSLEQIIVTATNLSCSNESKIVNLKFSFGIPDRIKLSQVTSATMWLYTDANDSYMSSKCLLTTKPCDLPSNLKSKELLFQTPEVKRGWIQKDVMWWLQMKTHCQRFKLSCTNDATLMFDCSRYEEMAKKPFLSISARDYSPDIYRDKRHVNCVDGVDECCRERLHISFADIGWGNWIIKPDGYDAYYCKGTCANAGSIPLGATAYHSVIKNLFLSHGKAREFMPCCTPTRLSSLQLIYVVQNDTIINKTIPDLAVDSCGCM